MAVAVAVLALLAAGWLVFTAETIKLQIQPQPDALSIAGGLVLPVGKRLLLLPGAYTVVAEKAGYQRLEQPIRVRADDNPVFAFDLKKLPGRLRVRSDPAGAAVAVDGETVGATPLTSVTLASGTHELVLRAPRHEVWRRQVKIAGKNQLQTLAVKLTPAWAPVTITSAPAGATLKVDGEPRGTTPVTAEIGAGEHRIELHLDGYQPWAQNVTVVAGEPRRLDPIKLEKAPGRLAVSSSPAGASVSVNGDFRGRTPLTVSLAPGVPGDIRISKAGHEASVRQVTVAAGAQEQLAVDLQPILGALEVAVTPPGATVYVDGKARRSGSQTLRLTAIAHQISVREPGYVAFETSVTPKPGLTQTLTVDLPTEAEARAASIPDTIRAPTGGLMVAIPPGRFTMGAPRGSQGARANEVRREVRLTRTFYIAAHEVSNAHYRRFRASHSSGIAARHTLDNDDQPVVRLSWAAAIAYCNWLSAQAGLPKAYAGGELKTPVGTGYRLPTEAEWAWAARFAGQSHHKYPWGNRMPPTGSAGNYADTAAVGLVDVTLSGYTDGYAASAPVASFAPNAVGLFDLGGNVAEWVNDVYSAAPDGAGVETDPLGPQQGSAHVVRGSSWRDATITALRLSYRAAGTGPRDDLGFRVARYAE